MNKQYLILWRKNQKIGSVVLTNATKQVLKTFLHLSPIQKDDSGSEHYEILGLMKGWTWKKVEKFLKTDALAIRAGNNILEALKA